MSTRFLDLPGSRKLHDRWIGPFVVVERIGDVAYRLSLPDRLSGLHPVFYVSRLKAFHAGGGDGVDPGSGPLPVMIDGQ